MNKETEKIDFKKPDFKKLFENILDTRIKNGFKLNINTTDEVDDEGDNVMEVDATASKWGLAKMLFITGMQDFETCGIAICTAAQMIQYFKTKMEEKDQENANA